MDQGALGVELTGMFCSAANLSRSARPLGACQLRCQKARVSEHIRESVVELGQAPRGQSLQGGVAGLPCQLEANLARRNESVSSQRLLGDEYRHTRSVKVSIRIVKGQDLTTYTLAST